MLPNRIVESNKWWWSRQCYIFLNVHMILKSFVYIIKMKYTYIWQPKFLKTIHTELKRQNIHLDIVTWLLLTTVQGSTICNYFNNL
jgi:hypothetical protein